MNFIRISIVLTTFIALITADSIDNAIKVLNEVKNIQTCAKVDMDAIPQYISQQYSNIIHGDKQVTEEMACILGCTAKEFHLINEDNVFDKDKVDSIMTIFLMFAGHYKVPKIVTSPIKDAVLSCFTETTSYESPCSAAKEKINCAVTNIVNLYSEITGKK